MNQDTTNLATGMTCGGASGTLFHSFALLFADRGLDLATLAALMGATGTLLVALVTVSREVRAWLQRRDDRRFDRMMRQQIAKNQVIDTTNLTKGQILD